MNRSTTPRLVIALGAETGLLSRRVLPGRPGERNAPVLVIQVGLLYPLVFSPAVLEPDLDLGLGQLQTLGQLEPPGPGDVLVPLVFQFKS